MFQVGDEVYLRAKLKRYDDEDRAGLPWYLVSVDGNRSWWSREDDLIPAHRVTVAPARRKAEFPKDWGREVFTENGEGVLYGYIPGASNPYMVKQPIRGTAVIHVKTAEVEE